MLHRCLSSPAHMSSSSGQRMKWAIGLVGLTLRLMQQQRPTRNAGPLTRLHRPLLAVVRWLLLDSFVLWRYTVLVKNAIASTLFLLLLLAPLLMLWSGEKKPPGLVNRGAFFKVAFPEHQQRYGFMLSISLNDFIVRSYNADSLLAYVVDVSAIIGVGFCSASPFFSAKLVPFPFPFPFWMSGKLSDLSVAVSFLSVVCGA